MNYEADIQIDITNYLCEYGCQQIAHYQFKNGRYCCSSNMHACPTQRKNNGLRKIKEFNDNPIKRNQLAQRMKGKIPWCKGLTKETDIRIKKFSDKIKGIPKNKPAWNKGIARTEEEKNKIATTRKLKKIIPWNKGKKMPASMGINRMGILNPCWRGGTSFEPYSSKWTTELKNKIKIRDNNQCVNPGCKTNTNKIYVHHIDYNKQNCEPNNLITLCHNCHSKTNHKRELWKSFYQTLMKGIICRQMKKVS